MINNIFSSIDYIKKGLDASWQYNDVLADNIANVDTPNFKRSYVNFDSLLNTNEILGLDMKTTREEHFSINNTDSQTSVVQDNNTTVRMDGNNVDIEYEQAELAKNQIWYNYMVQKVSNEFGRLNLSINGGK